MIGLSIIFQIVLVLVLVSQSMAGRPILDERGNPTGLINANPNPEGPQWIAGGFKPRTATEYRVQLNRARESAAARSKLQRPLPAMVDNSKHPMLVPIFEQWKGSCGAASGTGYTYTYEINSLRGGLDASRRENQYPYNWVWHFTNQGDGSKGAWSHDTYILANNLGIPPLEVYGGDFRNQNESDWMHGYDKYFKAFKNRAMNYIRFPAQVPEDLEEIKGWLYDHNNGSQYGGLLNFDDYIVGVTYAKTQGSELPGRSVMIELGDRGAHSKTIVGYNDNISYDVNNDGRFTNDEDINGDGKVDIGDWEVGAFHVINTWGTGWQDGGHSYMLYRVMAENPIVLPDTVMQRGLWGHIVKGMLADDRETSVAFKINLASNHRNQFRFRVGFAPDKNATEPEKTYSYIPAFVFSGGDLPARGKGKSPEIEVGLDISWFNQFDTSNSAKFWLIVDTRVNGEVLNKLTLMDYTSGQLKETPYRHQVVNLEDNTTLYFPIERFTPTLSDITLNTGSSLVKGGLVTINWNANNNDPVKIELLNGGIVVATITSSVTGGTHNWLVPFDLPADTDYQIRVTNLSNPTVTAETISNLSISDIVALKNSIRTLGGFSLFPTKLALPDKAISYELYDTRGNRLQKVGPGIEFLDISTLSGGVYFIHSSLGQFKFVR